MLDPRFIEEHTLLAAEFSHRSNPQQLCEICTQPRWRTTCAFKHAGLCILHVGRPTDIGVSRPQCISMVNWVWHNIWRVVSSPWKDLQTLLGFPPRERSVEEPEAWIRTCVDWLVNPISGTNPDILNVHLALTLPSMLDDPLRVGAHRTPNEFRALLPLTLSFRSIQSVNYARKILRALDDLFNSTSPCQVQVDKSIISPFSERTLSRRYDFIASRMVIRDLASSMMTDAKPVVTTVRYLNRGNGHTFYRRTNFIHANGLPPRSPSGAFLPSSVDEPLSDADDLVDVMFPTQNWGEVGKGHVTRCLEG
jgi:hypothetical protein